MLIFLVKNRIKHKAFTVPWVKSWAKRLLHVVSTLRISFKVSYLRFAGAEIGNLSVVNCHVLKRNCKRLLVGSHTYIASTAQLALHEEIHIGCSVVINSGVKIYTASHDINSPSWPITRKPIRINDYAWVASDSIILPGVTIGYGAVVGAGAVVSRDVADYEVVVGNPATVVKIRRGPFSYSPTAFTSPIECWLGADKFQTKPCDTDYLSCHI